MRLTLSILILLALVLISCSKNTSNPPAITVDTKTQAMTGIIRLELSGLNSGQVQTQVINEENNLTFTNGVFANLADVPNQKLLVLASYNLEVPSDVTNLTFIAVDVHGDNIAGTAVHSLATNPPGTGDPSLIAQAIQPSHGMQLGVTPFVVDEAQADLFVLNEGEAAQLLADANNAGAANITTALSNVLDYGFVAQCAASCGANKRLIPGSVTNAGLVNFAFILDTSVLGVDSLSSLAIEFLFTSNTETIFTKGLDTQASRS